MNTNRKEHSVNTVKNDPTLTGLRSRLNSKTVTCSSCNWNIAEFEHRVEHDNSRPKMFPEFEPLCRRCREMIYYHILEEENLPEGICSVSTASALLEGILNKSHRTLYPYIHELIRKGRVGYVRYQGPMGRPARYVNLIEVFHALKETYGW